MKIDRILKFLGVAWSIVAFIAAAAFFIGGEWQNWNTVKSRVLDTEWPPKAPTGGHAGEVLFIGPIANQTAQFELPPKTNATVLVLSSTLHRDGAQTDEIVVTVSATGSTGGTSTGLSRRSVQKGGASGHYWGYSTLLPVLVGVSNSADTSETYQVNLSGHITGEPNHMVMVIAN